jgi:phosphatidylglycerophosphatase C
VTATPDDRQRPRVAAFDVDGTLTTADCVVPFLRRTVGTPTLVRRMLRAPIGLTRAGVRRDRDALKAASAAATFRGLPIELVEADARLFAREVHDRRLRREVVESLRVHADAGHTVLLVSASFEVYLRPLAERREVQLTCERQPGALVARIDPKLVRRALVNLIVNAIK